MKRADASRERAEMYNAVEQRHPFDHLKGRWDKCVGLYGDLVDMAWINSLRVTDVTDPDCASGLHDGESRVIEENHYAYYWDDMDFTMYAVYQPFFEPAGYL
eukprot:GHRR01025781.1.p3 GENE.GHRR01025781.1~~GHRR01025781.1.p3  ORF type:complete len:102 (-),score=7.65 GHRR01025781.1:332-637(-)